MHKNMNGTIGERSEKTEIFANALKEKINTLDVTEPDLDDLRRAYGALNGVARPTPVERPESIDRINTAISILEEKEKSIRKRKNQHRSPPEAFLFKM